MAERLTGKDIRNTTILKVDKDNMHIYNTTTEDGEEETVISCDAITRLGQFEDILEKYGIEGVEELEKRLQNLFELTCGRKNGKTIARKIILFDKMKQDRDTWKRACELACEDLQFYDYGNEKTEDGIIMKVDYFYQQAKKGKGEKDDK